MKKVAIIIINWNGKKFLKDCINAINKQTYTIFDIYFVDNGSKDNSSEYVKKLFPKVNIVQLDKNYGYAKGNNLGTKQVLKDKNIQYIVYLNNDTIVDKNWLASLVKTIESKKEIGGISSKAYFIGGKIIQNAGLIYSKALQINKQGGISLGYGLSDNEIPELNKDYEIFCPSGVAPMYKREVLEKLLTRDNEIFDEDFFAYVEDYDLGFRIKGLGYSSYLSANAKLIHLHSQTGGKASLFKTYYLERNTYLTAIKNLGFLDLILYPFRNIKLKITYFLKKNESVESFKKNYSIFKMIYILIKAHFSMIILIPKFLKKRFIIKRKNNIN